MRKTYSQEINNMVVILCNNPSQKNLQQFWEEVFAYFQKGYVLYTEGNRKFCPLGMGRQRVTLVKGDAKVEAPAPKAEETKEPETKVDSTEKPKAPKKAKK